MKTKKSYMAALYPFKERQVSDPFFSFHERVRFDLIMNTAKIKKGDAFLDAGCGTGFLCLEAARAGAYGVGLDLSRHNLSELQKAKNQNIAVVLGDIEYLPFKEECFTVVVATEVLEHLLPKNVIRALSELRRVLRMGKRVLITVPNLLWPWRWLAPLKWEDYLYLTRKPWTILAWYLKKWRRLLRGFHNGFINEGEYRQKNFHVPWHACFFPTYLKQMISKQFTVVDFKSTLKWFYWTLPLIPLSIQKKVAEAFTSNKLFLRHFGVQLIVLGMKE